jgi:hypothetical protein
MCAYRLFNQAQLCKIAGWLIKMNEQFQGSVFGQLFGVFDNVVVCVSIQIPAVEWGGIDRVEQLVDMCDVHLDALRG